MRSISLAKRKCAAKLLRGGDGIFIGKKYLNIHFANTLLAEDERFFSNLTPAILSPHEVRK